MASREKLLGIQFCRGIAATLVVLYHAGRMLALPQYVGRMPLNGIFNFGNCGVDFFFVLSGFIIFFVHGKDIGRPDRLLPYLYSRVTRIYPPYWFATGIVVAVALVRRGGVSLDPTHLVLSLFLVPQSAEPVLQVGWTLVCEMLFYIGFAVAIASRTAGKIMLAAWVAAALIGTLGGVRLPISDTIVSYQIQFAMGILTANQLDKLRHARPGLVAIFGIALFAVAAWLLDTGSLIYQSAAARVLLGVACMFIIFGVARLEIDGTIRIGRVPAFLGSASYSIYLIHTIAISAFLSLFASPGFFQGWSDAGFVLITVSAIAIGGIVYSGVERPMLRFFRARRLDGLQSGAA
jgi:peptidoglycan/LPS O-acetylase OafA/YrhL